MNTSSNPEIKESIESIRQGIIDLSERYYKYLKEREEDEYVLRKKWFFVLIDVIIIFLSEWFVLQVLPQPVGVAPIVNVIVIAIVAIIFCSVVFLLYMRISSRYGRQTLISEFIWILITKKHRVSEERRSRYSELSYILTRIKSMEGMENLSETNLRLVDYMIKILPEVKRKKLIAAKVYGILFLFYACTIIPIFIGTLFKQIPLEITLPNFLPLCALICILFSRFEEFRRNFERQKEEFIKSVNEFGETRPICSGTFPRCLVC